MLAYPSSRRSQWGRASCCLVALALYLQVQPAGMAEAQVREPPALDDDDSASDDDDSASDDDDSASDDQTDVPISEVSETIVVIVKRAERTDTHARTAIDGTALERTRGQDLARAIAQVSGVTAARGTADSSKPIIRGQHERRLLVLFDGVRHHSQKWGADHATEIDPFAAGRLSVVKGAAGVRYGPDAIGGVVLVEPPKLLSVPGAEGVFQLVGGLANSWRVAGAGRLDIAPAVMPGLAARVEGNYARGTSLRTPSYVLGNTASQQWNASATVRYQRRAVHLALSYRHYDLRGGICFCVKNSTPDDFTGQLDANEPVGAEAWRIGFDIGRPFQAVTHDVFVARGKVQMSRVGSLGAVYAFQINRRREFEQVRSAVTGPQYDFTLRTHSLDLEFRHVAGRLGRVGSMSGGVGLAGSFQENVYSGLPLVPNHRAFSFGVFGVERLSTTRAELEIGGRYDHQARTSFLTDSAFDRHRARDTLAETDCERSKSSARCPLAFDSGSLSVGLLVQAVPDLLEIKLDLSSATRFPNGDELYMNGSAPTYPVYALGDPSLGPETTWGASPTLGLRLPWLEAEASVYVNYIDDYIYFAPEIGGDGQPRFDVTIRGAFPRFTYRAVDALFYGFDGGLTLGPDWPVSLKVHGALVRAEDLSSSRPLLFTPADRVGGAVRGTPPDAGRLHDGFIEVSGEYVFRQSYTDDEADLAPAPPGYFLLGAAAGVKVQVGGGETLELGVEANNLLNASYRDYTSLLRYYAAEPGLDVRLRLRFEFHHPRTMKGSAHATDPPNSPRDPDDLERERLHRHGGPRRGQRG